MYMHPLVFTLEDSRDLFWWDWKGHPEKPNMETWRWGPLGEKCFSLEPFGGIFLQLPAVSFRGYFLSFFLLIFVL